MQCSTIHYLNTMLNDPLLEYNASIHYLNAILNEPLLEYNAT